VSFKAKFIKRLFVSIMLLLSILHLVNM